MTDREKLIEILRVPIYPHELADPTEVVAEYLLDNGVVPVVRCKDCKHWCEDTLSCMCGNHYDDNWYAEDFCSYGERKDNERKAD